MKQKFVCSHEVYVRLGKNATKLDDNDQTVFGIPIEVDPEFIGEQWELQTEEQKKE